VAARLPLILKIRYLLRRLFLISFVFIVIISDAFAQLLAGIAIARYFL
jgi:hypothetical protein